LPSWVSVLVVVVVVGGVPMAVVDVVDVVLVRNRDVAAAFTVRVLVRLVGGVPRRLALVVVAVVRTVQVAVVGVVDVVAMRDGDVAAAVAVCVAVGYVFRVGSGHLLIASSEASERVTSR
jgi:hypothetical protein